MEIFKRKEMNKIEDIDICNIEAIMKNNIDNKSFRVAEELFNTLILRNNKKIKCICNYYCNVNNKATTFKGKTMNNCPRIQIFLGIKDVECFECKECHLEAIKQLKNKRIKLIQYKH